MRYMLRPLRSAPLHMTFLLRGVCGDATLYSFHERYAYHASFHQEKAGFQKSEYWLAAFSQLSSMMLLGIYSNILHTCCW